jgi:hypothetical protein
VGARDAIARRAIASESLRVVNGRIPNQEATMVRSARSGFAFALSLAAALAAAPARGGAAKQQRTIEAQREQIAALMARLAALESAASR